jgi:hypothetical protein
MKGDRRPEEGRPEEDREQSLGMTPIRDGNEGKKGKKGGGDLYSPAFLFPFVPANPQYIPVSA